MKKILFILLLPLTVFCQQGVVKGKVYDSHTKQALIGANIIVVGASRGAACNIKGEYDIRSMSPGKYTLRCTYIGYKPVVKNIIVKKQEQLAVDFYLNADNSKKRIIVTKQKDKILIPFKVVPL